MSESHQQKSDPHGRMVGIAPLLNPEPLSPDRLPMLPIVIERFGRLLNSAFRQLTNGTCEVHLSQLKSCRFDQFSEQEAPWSVFAVGRVEGWDTRVLTRVDNVLLKTVVHAMLGGRADMHSIDHDAPTLTPIDVQFTQILNNNVMKALSDSLKALMQLNCRHERTERDIRFAAIVQSTAPVFLADFQITLNDVSGSLVLVLPLAALEPIKPLLSQRFAGEQSGRDADWYDNLHATLSRVQLPLEFVVGEKELNLTEILALKPGDILPLAVPSGRQTLLYANGNAIAQGSLHDDNGYYSVTLEKAIRNK